MSIEVKHKAVDEEEVFAITEAVEIPNFISQSFTSSQSIIVEPKKKLAIVKAKEKKKKQKKQKPKTYSDCLEECLKKGMHVQGYESPCGGPCTQGRVYEIVFGHEPSHLDHDGISNALEAGGIVINRDTIRCRVCEDQCDDMDDVEEERDETWYSYHLAVDHGHDIYDIIEELKNCQ
jgi:hypothetical protein